MSALPLVSVVIPAYGRPAFLRDGITAILDCDYSNLQIIVVDDGSPYDIAATLVGDVTDPRVQFVWQENAGTAAARNFGASRAEGEYLLFIDDDDLAMPTSIHWRVDFLERHSECSAVAGRCLMMENAQERRENETFAGNLVYWDLVAANRIMSPGQVLIRKSSFRRTAEYRRDCFGCDDWDLWLQLCSISPMHLDERVVLKYRVHSGNVSRNDSMMLKGALVVAERAVSKVCPRHRAIARCLVYDYLNSTYRVRMREAARSALKERHLKQFVQISYQQFGQFSRNLLARFRQKVTLVLRYRRYKLPYAEWQSFGRDCRDCNAE